MAVSANPTQKFVPIQEIKDNVVSLKDGGLCAVLMASSINFSLKSEDERNAIIFQFQDFLNSLDFSLQIIAQSRRFDIRPYIALLEQQKKGQLNSLLKIQIQEYIEFVKSFTEQTNIMTKTFYVVVPYTPALLGGNSSLNSFLPTKKKDSSPGSNAEENLTQLEQRIAVVSQGLSRCGVRTSRLGTE